uniref:Protein FAM72A n=1 Tax=Serinus canaria TaxID=9135 RepID=A0A8C9NC47_SERCA
MSSSGCTFADRCVSVLCCRFCRQVLSWRGCRRCCSPTPTPTPTSIPPTSGKSHQEPPFPQADSSPCLSSGNVVGYHVICPCKPCLQSCTNGHLWMFHSQAVFGIHRLDPSGVNVLLWGNLPALEESTEDTSCPSEEEFIR